MEINLIVAIGRNGEIGKNGDLPWHISEDLKHFKSLTMGHPVIMGRKTWESLPTRPLPGRRNIVITGNPDFHAEGAETASSPAEALRMTRNEYPFIIGGGKIYKDLMPYVTTLYLTLIDADEPEADTFISWNPEEWIEKESSDRMVSKNGLGYRFVSYKRK